jgi:hypothetical protein
MWDRSLLKAKFLINIHKRVSQNSHSDKTKYRPVDLATFGPPAATFFSERRVGRVSDPRGPLMFASRHHAYLCCRGWLNSVTRPTALSPPDFAHSVRFASSGGTTIFAPSTAPGKAAISIVRITGPNALQAWHRMTGPRRAAGRSPRETSPTPPPQRRPVLRTIRHSQNRELLDEALVIYFPRMLALATAYSVKRAHTTQPGVLTQLRLLSLRTTC